MMRFSSLVLPILVENLVRTSLMAVDQLMLYAYSEKAAAAMSTVNQMAFFIQLIYAMVAIGAGILISQNLGAGKQREAGDTALAGFVLVTLFSLFLSIAVVLSVPLVLGAFGLEPVVYDYAKSYLSIFGGLSIFMAMNIVQATILRTHGYAKYPMLVNTLVLGLNIIGNSIALFGPFGLPVFGVPGVAVSTVLSQVVAFFCLGKLLRKKCPHVQFKFREALKLPRRVYTSILAVGMPTAGENLSYNVSQIVIISFIARMGTYSLAAYGLVITLSRYVFIAGVSIGQATQIMVGHLSGAGRFEEAKSIVYRNFLIGLSISICMVVLLNLFKVPIIGLFTQEPAITTLVSSVLLMSLILEPARTLNTIFVPALKGTGDVRFPAVIALIFMWLFGVLGARIFGLALGLGLVGVWIGLSMDEWTRGIINLLRWRSGQWRKKVLVTR